MPLLRGDEEDQRVKEELFEAFAEYFHARMKYERDYSNGTDTSEEFGVATDRWSDKTNALLAELGA